jgi:pseudouridine synthase
MRLNRYLAKAGVASRRACDEIISSGRVKVNGLAVSTLGTDIDPERDSVEVDGRPVSIPPEHTYLMLNKPPGYVVTMKDPQGRRVVSELIVGIDARIFPVGRLDVDTEGLLIMTDDGDLAHRILHPSFELTKVYEVVARGVLSIEQKETLEGGVIIDGRRTAPARVRIVSSRLNTTVAVVSIHEGRKRQLRRMFEAVGHPVRRLRRVRVGPIELGGLPLGKWRHLEGREVDSLMKAVSLSPDGREKA